MPDTTEVRLESVEVRPGARIVGRSYSTSYRLPRPVDFNVDRVFELGGRTYVVGTDSTGRVYSMRTRRFVSYGLQIGESDKDYTPAITDENVRGWMAGMRNGVVGFVEPADVSDKSLRKFFEDQGGIALSDLVVDSVSIDVGPELND